MLARGLTALSAAFPPGYTQMIPSPAVACKHFHLEIPQPTVETAVCAARKRENPAVLHVLFAANALFLQNTRKTRAAAGIKRVSCLDFFRVKG